MMSYNKTVFGILWNFSDQLLRRGISIITTLALAFFLEPSSFGLIAIITVFIAIASTIMDSGLKQAIIRSKNTDQELLSTAFFSNIAFGFIAFILLAISAPVVAHFYAEESLTHILIATGSVVLINSLKVVHEAIISRDLNFKLLMLANIPAAFISSILALLLAYFDFGIWALSAQIFIASALLTLTIWIKHPWRPSLTFSIDIFYELYAFGYKLLLSSLIDILFRNIYILTIAKLFSSTVSGFYFFTSKIVEIINTQLVNTIQTATYPSLSKLQNNPDQLKISYQATIILTTFIAFPTFFFLAALSEPIFIALLPSKWNDAALYLQLLCLSGSTICLHSINLNILQVKGRSDLFLRLEIIKKSIFFVIFIISIQYGIIEVILGQIISAVLAYIPNSHYTKILINYKISEQISDFLPNLLLAAIIAIPAYLLVESNWIKNSIVIFLFPPIMLVLYLLLAWILKLKAITLIKNYKN